MNKFLLLAATACTSLLLTSQDLLFSPAQAAPAMRRIVTLTQPDGSTLQAIPMGDENMSYWIDAETGLYLTQDAKSKYWRIMTDAEATVTYNDWTESRKKAAKMYSSIRTIGGVSPKNSVKLPVLLVEFDNLKLTEEFGSIESVNSMLNDLDYDRIVYSSGGQSFHTGSVRKYWNIQSLGKFDPQFDILAKISLKNGYEHYGKDNGSHDTNINALFNEVMDSVMAKGLLSQAAQYDNNNDKVIDCIYIIYAGYGQNESRVTDQIWAKNTTNHIYELGNGFKTNLFLLSPELFGVSQTTPIIAPNIGVFTHEFGHSIGLPDFYSTNTSTQNQCYGMDSWSLMDQGEYNGIGQIPGCLTTHERMLLGWLDEPTEINPNSKDTLYAFASSGDARIIHNPEDANEYITIENHQPENAWEVTWGNGPYYKIHAHDGLLITYVYYNQGTWNANGPNNDPNFQRCSPISADGERMLFDGTKIWRNNLSADIYPGLNQIKTLNSNNPLFHWHNGDTVAFNINDIEKLADNRIVITFGNPPSSSLDVLTVSPNTGKAVKKLRNGKIYIEKDGVEYDLLGRKMQASKL